MLRAFVDKIDRTGVNGWAVDTNDLTRRVPVRILCNRSGFTQRLVSDTLRPDLIGYPGMGDGKHGFSCRFPPEVSGHEALSIAIVYEETGATLPGGYMAYPSRAAPELAPIIVTAQGRSGTTMMMNTLLQSPEVCVAGNPPFEIRMAHYFAMAFNVLTAEADPKRSTDPDDMNFESKWIGSNPFFDLKAWAKGAPPDEFYRYFNLDVPGYHLDTSRTAIIDFYKKDALAKGKTNARFFAEKNIWAVRIIPKFLQMMFPRTKELILVRDPRDLIVSQRSYFKEVRATHIQEISRHCAQYLDIISRDPDETMVIKYEELIFGWEAESKRVAQFLGVDIPLEARRSVDKTFASHARSSSPESSIGRWRRELSEDDRADIETSCASFMERFEYA